MMRPVGACQLCAREVINGHGFAQRNIPDPVFHGQRVHHTRLTAQLPPQVIVVGHDELESNLALHTVQSLAKAH